MPRDRWLDDDAPLLPNEQEANAAYRRFFKLSETGLHSPDVTVVDEVERARADWLRAIGESGAAAEAEAAWRAERARHGGTVDGAMQRALAADDAAEDRGGHADDRRTCWTCKTWADHAHDPLTGARMTLEDYEERRRARGW